MNLLLSIYVGLGMYNMPSEKFLDISAFLVFMGFGLFVLYLIFNLFL